MKFYRYVIFKFVNSSLILILWPGLIAWLGTPALTLAGAATFNQIAASQQSDEHRRVEIRRLKKLLKDPRIPNAAALRRKLISLLITSQAPSREIIDAVGQELDCQDPMFCIYMAQSLADRGEHLDAALAFVQRAFTFPPVPNDAVPRESFFLVVAHVRIKRGEYEEAIATLKRGVAGAPYYSRDERYLSYLGLAYEKRGRIDEAIETYISLAAGVKTVSDKPGEALLALYRERYGSLIGLEERIEARRRRARREMFVDSQLLSIPAPDWVLQDLNGGDVSLSDFANRVVVLRFVTTQFEDDVEKLKFLQGQYEQYKDRGIAFVLVDEGYPHPIEQRRLNIRRALDRVDVTIPIVVDPDGAVAKRYGTMESLIVLIDENRVIRFKNWLWHDYHPFVTEQIEYLLKPRE
jgi:tetratricopeptide (TPR) repeat protein